MSDPTPFTISASDVDLADLHRRLATTRWPNEEPVDDWTQGIPLDYVKEVCAYWADGYDWRKREARLNAFPQFTTPIDGVDIHFVHQRSPVENALLCRWTLPADVPKSSVTKRLPKSMHSTKLVTLVHKCAPISKMIYNRIKSPVTKRSPKSKMI